MKVIEINDYLIHYVDKICNERFSKDIMLVFNDYKEDTKEEIINLVHQKVAYFFDHDIHLDYELIKIICSMFLGLSWSMYRKGKNLYKNDETAKLIIIGNGKEYFFNNYFTNLYNDKKFKKDINDIVIRYYTLYISKYSREIIKRMKSLNETVTIDEMSLKDIFLNTMKDFSRENIIFGIQDEIMNIKK